MASKIEYLPLVDNVAEEMGRKIESIYPFLQLLNEAKVNTPEYTLLNKIWMDWCHYLDG
ncbi:unnamed protein product [marine sediment metagenome]|uniref:Uncharacterized protein n=1 Tax=marine sediment metagenome TaxID=412755 RepID=X0S404_9ZZZZ